MNLSDPCHTIHRRVGLFRWASPYTGGIPQSRIPFPAAGLEFNA